MNLIKISFFLLLGLLIEFSHLYAQCNGEDAVEQPYCYNEDETKKLLTSFCPANEGEVVSINISGQTEECCDIINFYSGALGTSEDSEYGQLSGIFSNHIVFGRPDECLSMYINSDFSVNCSNSDFVPLSWTSSCVVPPPPLRGDFCNNPIPLCLNTSDEIKIKGSNKGSEAEAGNNYGCLFQEPEPTWCFFKIEQAGDLSIKIQGLEDDIDFAAWGPFSDEETMRASCGSLSAPESYEDAGEDFCSFSSENSETLIIKDSEVGEYYLLMITNQATTAQTITIIEENTSEASTDCSALDAFKVIDFEGLAVDRYNRINWTTNHEFNTAFHILERAENDSLNFFEIGRIGIQNPWLVSLNYTFDDQDPREYAWYRIRTVMQNGDNILSELILIERGRNGFHFKRIYPNPVRNLLVAEFIGIQGENVTLRVLDATGREIYREEIETFSGINTLEFDMNRFTAGVYVVFIENGTLRFSRRLVKADN